MYPAAAVALTVLFWTIGCADPDRSARRRDATVERVVRSDDLHRLALTAGGRTVVLPLVRDCSAGAAGGDSGGQHGRAGVIAPPCRPRRKPERIPLLEAPAGGRIELATGRGAAVVSIRGVATRGSRPPVADAEPLDDRRQHWRARLPGHGAGSHGRFTVSVSPLRTDSGSLELAFEIR